MKKFYLLLALLWQFTTLSSQTINIAGVLSGDQEVPAVSTSATGSFTGTIDMTTGSVSITVDYADLSGTLTAAHIHTAPRGVNGSVVLNLAPSTGNNSGTFSQTGSITGDDLLKVLAEGSYVNLHTTAHNGGELRGQVIMKDKDFRGTLNVAESSAPNSGSNGTGSVTGFYDDTTNELKVYAIYANTTSTPSAAHVHRGAAGVAGGVAFGLNAGSGNDEMQGIYSATSTLSSADEDLLNTDALYVNIHTAANGGGEIRTQLEAVNIVKISGTLSGDQEVPPVSTSATGSFTGMVNMNTGDISINVTYSNLSGTLTAAHIHTAPKGVNGDVVLNLAPPTGGASGAFVTEGNISGTDLLKVLAEGSYVNLHTSAHGGGELRGQVMMDDKDFGGELTVAESSAPNSGSNGTGSVTGFYDDEINELKVYAIYAETTSTPSAAHVHRGAAGVAGGVAFGLTAGSGNDEMQGVYSATATLNTDDEGLLNTNALYVNIHTAANGGGEIRTQLESAAALAIDYSTAQAKVIGQQVELQWKVTDSNVTNFIIEQAEENADFYHLTTIAANTGQSEYAFTTNNLPQGQYYFRIRAIEVNGEETVSKVMTARILATVAELTLFPNPAQEEIYLNYSVLPTQLQTATLLSTSGQVMQRVKVQPEQLGEALPFDLKELPVGMYYIQLGEQMLPFYLTK